MLLNIIFSYNRAMQLDFLLKSILNRFKISDYQIAIVYHTTGDHRIGYELLKSEYQQYEFIKFHERKDGFDFGIIPALINRSHFSFFNKYHLRNPKRDNFKGLLENILSSTPYEFVMFNTDDGCYYDNFYLNNEILNLIRNNPRQVSFRTYVGENLIEFPDFVKKWSDLYLWDYYHTNEITHWTFPFAVDGTIFHSKGILSILKKVAYHNPVTLEENGVSFIRSRKLLGIGLSPLKSCLVCTKLNRVSVDSSNPTIHIKPEFLNEKFLNGFKLELQLQKEINNANLVPEKIVLFKGDSKEIIYELDEFGRTVQNNLGSEGAKTQMD